MWARAPEAHASTGADRWSGGGIDLLETHGFRRPWRNTARPSAARVAQLAWSPSIAR
jgi:hypothetical protein